MNNNKQYALRMEKNINDKLVIFDFMEKNPREKLNILDFGCGSGSLITHLETLYPKSKLVGFDKSEFMIKRAKENSHVGLFLSRFDELELFVKNNGHFDYILLNSVLHEIYSYENRFDSVVDLLKKLSQYLRNKGNYIVRDGLLDTTSVTDENQTEQIELINPEEAMSFLNEYTKLSPFPNKLSIEDGKITGRCNEVREFLNKYTWGFESLYRESQEIVNFASKDMYHELFNLAGFKIERELILSQEDFFSHLSKIVKIGEKRWNTKIVFSAIKRN